MAASLDTAHRLALEVFRVLPVPLRRMIARRVTPQFSVGAVALVRHGDRALMVRQRHHNGWGLPGGLLARGEVPGDALRRELGEELALDVDPPPQPAYVVVAPVPRRLDLLYEIAVHERPAVTPDGMEVLEVAWQPLDIIDVTVETADLLRAVRRGR